MAGARFSLRGLLAFVGLVAIACATFTNASHLVSSIVLTATVVVLLVTLVGVVYREGGERAFWVGAAIFGWGYMFFVYSDMTHLEGRLVTDKLMRGLFRYMHPNSAAVDWATGKVANPNLGTFQQLGHAFSALALALFGGFFARCLHATRHEADDHS